MGDAQQRIQPRTLKGFRDYLPQAAIPREWLIARAREVYRSYGFSPIDTPALEYEEILAGKGGQESEKQMFRFEDAGGRRVAMRFDLTVPLARFVAQYAHELAEGRSGGENLPLREGRRGKFAVSKGRGRTSHGGNSHTARAAAGS